MRIREASSLTADGNLRLSGVAVRYNEETGPPRLQYRERVAPGAFTPIGDVRLNKQHNRGALLARTGGGGLVLTDTADALLYEAQLPDTQEARDVWTLVRSGVMRGASIEFAPIRERQLSGVTVVERAVLAGLGIVDTGAYVGARVEAREAVEIRQDGQGLRATYAYNTLKTISTDDDTRKESTLPGALGMALADSSREVNVVIGRNSDKVIGSKLAGSARFTDGADTLFIDVPALPATQAVSDLRAKLAAGSSAFGVDILYQIPPADVVPDAVVDVEEPGNPGVFIRELRNVTLTAVAIVDRPPRGTSNEIELRQQRRRLWL